MQRFGGGAADYAVYSVFVESGIDELIGRGTITAIDD